MNQNRTVFDIDEETDAFYLQKVVEYHEWLIQQEAQPRLTRTPIFRDREDAERRLRADYFDDHSAIRQMAYGNTPDAFDEYLQMSEHTARDALFFFNMCIMELYMPKYLRKPTFEDVVKIQQKHNNVHDFPGILRSIDCMHWEWKNCPVSWQVEYRKGYYLADEIYPEWASFVKSFTVATDPKHTYFKQHQESARKDVERAFGVLQGRWRLIQQPARAYKVNTLRRIIYVVIIMHNMILEDQNMSVVDLKHVYSNPARSMQTMWIDRCETQHGAVDEDGDKDYCSCPTPKPITPLNHVVGSNNNYDHPPSLQDQILNHISSLETLIKQHNEKAGTPITPIHLTFGEEVEANKGKDKGKGPREEVDEDLKKPYKEVLKSPFTKRIIEFSTPSHRMPTNLKIYDGPTYLDDHITRFVGAANQGEWELPVYWADLCGKFAERFALRRKCSKDPTEVSKIIRRANEMLSDFKEHWIEEMGYIQCVPEVMQISAFMSNSKCPELARRFADRVLQTMTEMMKREVNQLSLEALVKRPKEILATELQLQLPPCPSMIETPKKENLDRYCDYHGEKGHYSNDCYQLKRQLKAALESRKLNHLVKDVRQRGSNRGRQSENNITNGKVINMVYVRGECQKRKFQKRNEVEVEGYLVRIVFVDQGAAVQVSSRSGSLHLVIRASWLFVVSWGVKARASCDSWFLLVVPAGRLYGSYWSAYGFFCLPCPILFVIAASIIGPQTPLDLGHY
ncbi:reverse transcriptase domain-containing protein [Tanacetum coccineum]